MGRFTRTTSETKFYFISPAIVTNINIIFLRGKKISFRFSCKHPHRGTVRRLLEGWIYLRPGAYCRKYGNKEKTAERIVMNV